MSSFSILENRMLHVRIVLFLHQFSSFHTFHQFKLPSGLEAGLEPPSSGLGPEVYPTGLFKHDLILGLLQSFLRIQKTTHFPHSAFK